VAYIAELLANVHGNLSLIDLIKDVSIYFTAPAND